jgi:cytochrome c
MTTLTTGKFMKLRPLLAIAAVALTVSFPSTAAVDAEAAVKVTKSSGCGKCHSVDKPKKGPAYQKIAAKYKGKADGEAKLTEFVSTTPKVKMDDGSEEEHKAINTKDPAQIKNLVQWVLAQ